MTNTTKEGDVDPVALDAFLGRLRAELNLSHQSLLLLLRGVCVHLLALGCCIGALPHAVAILFPDEWTAEAKALAGQLPKL